MPIDFDTLSPDELSAIATGDQASWAKAAAQRHGVPEYLVDPVIKQESGGKQSAVSPKGAKGVMQLMPGTAKSLGVDPNDWAANIWGGMQYLGEQLKKFGSPELALAAYNAGPGRVKGGKVPDIKETKDYVRNIMGSVDMDSLPPEELARIANNVGKSSDLAGYGKWYSGPKEGIARMDDGYLNSFERMAQEYYERTGKTLKVDDAWRSYETQAKAYADWKAGRKKAPVVAAPGTSMHEKGLAMDINTEQANQLAKLTDPNTGQSLLEKYGFERPVKGEPWHVQARGADLERRMTATAATVPTYSDEDLDKMSPEELARMAMGQPPVGVPTKGMGEEAKVGTKLGLIDIVTKAAGAIDPLSATMGAGIFPGPDDPMWQAPAVAKVRAEVANKAMTEALFPGGVPPEKTGMFDWLVRDLARMWPQMVGLMTMSGYAAPAEMLGTGLAGTAVRGAVPFALVGATEESPAAGMAKGAALGGTLGVMHSLTGNIPGMVTKWLSRIAGGATIGGGAAYIEGADANEIKKNAVLFALFEAIGMPRDERAAAAEKVPESFKEELFRVAEGAKEAIQGYVDRSEIPSVKGPGQVEFEIGKGRKKRVQQGFSPTGVELGEGPEGKLTPIPEHFWRRQGAGERQLEIDKAFPTEPGKEPLLWSREQGRWIDPNAPAEAPGVEGPSGAPKYSAGERPLGPEWYSRMARFMEDKLPGQGTPQGLFNTIKSWALKGQFKPDELKWSGLLPWLQEQKGTVTKQQVMDFLKGEGQVQVREVEKGGIENIRALEAERDRNSDRLRQIQNDRVLKLLQEFPNTPENVVKTISRFPDSIRAERHKEQYSRVYNRAKVLMRETAEEVNSITRMQRGVIEQLERGGGDTKFQSYLRLPPGGSNYRELLLTWPGQRGQLKELPPGFRVFKEGNLYGIVDPDNNYVTGGHDTPEAATKDALMYGRGLVEKGYQVPPGHAYGDPAADVNRFAHVFTDDRIIDGKKYLTVWELQSDWGQEGRRKGYKPGPEARGKLISMEAELEQLRKQRDAGGYDPNDPATIKVESDIHQLHRDINALADAINRGVPQFPFSKNWHEVALKKVLRKAAEEGYDGVAWASGDMVKERYDLSRHIDRIYYDPDNEALVAFDHSGNVAIEKTSSPDGLPDLIGKEAADKLLSKEPIRRADLTVAMEELDSKLYRARGELAEASEALKKAEFVVSKWETEFTRDMMRRPDYKGGVKEAIESLRFKEDDSLVKALDPTVDVAGYRKALENLYTADNRYVPARKEMDALLTEQSRLYKDIRDARVGSKMIDGVDLKVGGEWANRQYDQMMPQFMNKYGKQWGARVGEGALKEPAGFHPVTGEDLVETKKIHTLPITPDMKRSVLYEGQPMFRDSRGKAVPQVVNEETISKAFGGVGEVSRMGDGDWLVALPNGARIRIYPNSNIVVDPKGWMLGYQEPYDGQPLYGMWHVVNYSGVIQLAKEGPPTTLKHEVFHGAMEMALTEAEKADILKKYGTEENAAHAYEKWNPDKPDTLFGKIRDFFRNIWRSMFPGADSVFGKIESGEVWERPLAERTALEYDKPAMYSSGLKDAWEELKKARTTPGRPTTERVGAFRRLFEETRRMWAPETTSEEAMKTAQDYTRHMSVARANVLRAARVMNDYREQFAEMGSEAAWKLSSAMERGEKVPPEWEPYRRAQQEAFDRVYKEVSRIKDGHFNYRKFYAPHLYADSGNAVRFFDTIGRRPLEGKKGFLQPRYIPDMETAIKKHGLKPLFDNPVQQALAGLMEQWRFVAANDFINGLEKEGRFIPIKDGRPVKEVPPGFVKTDPRVFRNGYAPRGAIDVIHNHLMSEAGNIWYNTWKNMTAAWNAWHVTLSAFHGMTTTAHELSMGFAQGIPDIIGGMLAGDHATVARGLKNIGPWGIVRRWKAGTQAREEFFEPGKHGPEVGNLVKAVVEGGMLPEHTMLMSGTAAETFKELLTQLKGGEIGQAFRSTTHILGKPIMGYLVPRVKWMSTVARTQREMDILRDRYQKKYGTNWSPEVEANFVKDIGTVAYNERQFSDNIFGEIHPDNMHWNRAMSKFLKGVIAYPGWNIGTLRWMTGMARGVGKTVMGKEMDYQARRSLQFGAGLLITAGLANTIMHMVLNNGEAPEDWRDVLVGARTGRTLNNGSPERVTIASYMKDVAAMEAHPVKAVMSKLQAPFSIFKELYDNADYFGTEIIPSRGTIGEKATSLGKYIVGKAAPFGFSQMATGKSPITQYGGLVGFRTIPRALTNTSAMNRIDDMLQAQSPRTRTAEASETSRIVSDLKELGWSGKRGEMEEGIREAMSEGKLTGTQAKHIRRDIVQDKRVTQFKKLRNVEDALEVYRLGTPDERRLWRIYLAQKWSRSSADKRRKLMSEYKEATELPMAEEMPARIPSREVGSERRGFSITDE